MISHHLVSIGIFIALVFISIVAINSRSMAPLWMLTVFLPIFYLFMRPEIWLGLIIAIYQSGLTVPWAPTNMNFFHIFSILFAGLMLVRTAIHKSMQHRKTPVRKWVLLFAIVVCAVMLYRGTGIRFLGSPLWGGAGYAYIFIGVGIFYFGDLVSMSTTVWRRALVAMCLLSFIPLIAQILFSVSGGHLHHQYYFIQRQGFATSDNMLLSSDDSVTRLQSGTGSWLVLLPLFLLANPFSGYGLYFTLPVFVLSFVAIGFSGYRSGFQTAICIPAAWVFFGVKKLNWTKPVFFVVAAALALCLAAMFARHLPLSFQRSLSFIPFADVSRSAMDDATGSIKWRFEVWQRALEEVPRYLWIGQGLAFSARELQEITGIGTFQRDWAFVTRSYHNGPLSVILIFGLPGLIAAFGFLFSTWREYYRQLRAEWRDQSLYRLYRAVFAWYVVLSAGFCITYGDVQISFPQLFFVAMLLEGMLKTRDSAAPAQQEQAASGVVSSSDSQPASTP